MVLTFLVGMPPAPRAELAPLERADPDLYGRQSVVSAEDGFLEIAADDLVAISAGRAWDVLIDFDRVSQYMPAVDSSYVTERTDSSWVVRQVLHTQIFVPWTFRMEIEFLPGPGAGMLRFRQLSGSLKDYHGRWCLREVTGRGGEGVLIAYEARARMRYPVPDFVARYVVRQQIARMMSALTRELERASGGEEGVRVQDADP